MIAIPVSQLSIGALILFVLFYVQEVSEENPSIFRAGIFLTAAVEAAISMAFVS